MPINYSDINRLLLEAEALSDASQWHGFVCGLICTNEHADQILWQEFLDLQADDFTLIEMCYQEMQHLVEMINNDIQSPEYVFQLLLPEDADLQIRVAALASWCDCFLTAMDVSEENSTDALSAEGHDILADFAKIAEVILDVDDAGAETAEQAFFELSEYVRVSALLVYAELRPLNYADMESRVLH